MHQEAYLLVGALIKIDSDDDVLDDYLATTQTAIAAHRDDAAGRLRAY
ncbi:MAG TPA: hypothetical protein VGC41_08425 [Kofleriaceae bacterium]